MIKAIYALGAAVVMTGASNAAAMSPGSAADAARPALDYVSTLSEAGVLRMEGTETSTQRRFNFRVSRNGYVSGDVDGRRVSFWVAPAQRDRAVAAAVQRLAGTARASDTAGTR